MGVRSTLAALFAALAAGSWVGADVSSAPPSFHPERARLVRELKLPYSPISSLSQAILSGNGEVAAARVAGEIRFYSLLTAQEISKVEMLGGFHDGAFSYDGARYAAAGTDGKVRVWEIASGRQIREFDAGGGFS
jgi:WD40 repeat protein